MSGAKLDKVRLTRANIYGANLQGTSLFLADLRGAFLRQADLRRANLEGANLEHYKESPRSGGWIVNFFADLQKVNMGGAILRNASLMNSDLRGADLRGANLRGANLEGAIVEPSPDRFICTRLTPRELKALDLTPEAEALLREVAQIEDDEEPVEVLEVEHD